MNKEPRDTSGGSTLTGDRYSVSTLTSTARPGLADIPGPTVEAHRVTALRLLLSLSGAGGQACGTDIGETLSMKYVLPFMPPSWVSVPGLPCLLAPVCQAFGATEAGPVGKACL